MVPRGPPLRLLLCLLLTLGCCLAEGTPPLAKYYKALGLESNEASSRDIRKAYRSLAVSLHPEKVAPAGTGEAERRAAQEAFVTVAKAYEVLSDEVKRPRYDYLWRERGLDVDYSEQMDWTLIDQQIGLGSMHHRNTDTREAAGSRKWSMEEAEELARQAEELAKMHRDDDNDDENPLLNTLMLAGLGVTTLVSVLVPAVVYMRGERAKAEEKLRRKKPTGEKKAELVARSQEVAQKLQAEEQQRRQRKEQQQQQRRDGKQQAAGGGQQSEGWAALDPEDPFLACLLWLHTDLSYDSMLGAVKQQQPGADDNKAQWALAVLQAFREHVAEEQQQDEEGGQGEAMLGLVLEASQVLALEGGGQAALEAGQELVHEYLSTESEVRLKLDDSHERALKAALQALHDRHDRKQEQQQGEEAGDDDHDEEEEAALWRKVQESVGKLRGVALDRLRQAGGKLKGLKDQHWKAFSQQQQPGGGGLAAAKEQAPSLECVLGSRVASAAFAQHCELEGLGQDLELLQELRAVLAEAQRQAGPGRQAVKQLVEGWLADDEQVQALGVAPDIEEAVQELRVLLEEEEDEVDDDGGELMGAYLSEILEHERALLEEALDRFQRHRVQGLAGGRPDKSKLYAKLLKAAAAVLPTNAKTAASNEAGKEGEQQAIAAAGGGSPEKKRGGKKR